MRALRVALLCLPLAGCAAELTEAWEVIEPRLMGARIEVEGAPERPRPHLTERFSLRQFIALPGPLESPLASRYSMDAALCLGFQTPAGSAACIGEQELDPMVTTISDTEVLLSGLSLDVGGIAAPAELPPGIDPSKLAELVDLDRLALYGVLCVDGRAERVTDKHIDEDATSELFRCVDNTGAKFPEANAFSISVLLDRDRPIDRNSNPFFACDPAAPDSACALGVPRPGEALVPGSFVIARPKVAKSTTRELLSWPARDPSLPLPWQDCASDPTLLKLPSNSGEHTLRARFDPSDREQYQYEIESNGVKVVRQDREALLLSHAITSGGGELDRFFSKLDPGDPDSEAEISFAYTPPKQSKNAEDRIPENGRLVRFYFTLRDERGGVDYTTRELCVVPGAQPE